MVNSHFSEPVKRAQTPPLRWTPPGDSGGARRPVQKPSRRSSEEVSLSLCLGSGRYTSLSRDVSARVPPLLHAEGGGLPLYQGLLLGAAGDPGLRRDRLPADAPGRRGADSPPLWEGCEPGDGGAAAPALGERPAVDGAVLHRGAGDGHRAGTGTHRWERLRLTQAGLGAVK